MYKQGHQQTEHSLRKWFHVVILLGAIVVGLGDRPIRVHILALPAFALFPAQDIGREALAVPEHVHGMYWCRAVMKELSTATHLFLQLDFLQ